MAKTRSGGSDQPLNGLNLIGKATLNVLQAGGRCEITAAAEKRLYVSHEQVGFMEEVVCLRQLGSSGYIKRFNVSARHASSALERCIVAIGAGQAI
jgi:hypothetical protein